MSKLFTIIKLLPLFLLLENYAVCFIQAVDHEENDDKLVWAIRRLVQPACNIAPEDQTIQTLPSCTSCLSRPGKRGAPGPKGDRGPKGDKGNCTCDLTVVGYLTNMIQDLQDQIDHMKAAIPERFCMLVMKSGTIPDSAISFSSMHSASYCQRQNVRLDSAGAWCATTNTVDSQWVEVDLQKIQRVTGIITQGQGHNNVEWVTSLKIESGTIAGLRQTITENNIAKIFSPVNTNSKDKAYVRFPTPVMARYIRIIPMSYHGHMSMRFEVINC